MLPMWSLQYKELQGGSNSQEFSHPIHSYFKVLMELVFLFIIGYLM